MITNQTLELIEKYRSLRVADAVDFAKFNHIAIVQHSTAIEGSDLTEIESQVLIVDGLTPRGKSLEHSLMVRDHYNALLFVLKNATAKTPVTVEIIQEIAGRVLKGTGSIYETALGEVDATKGDFRKGSVRVGSSRFPSYDKVKHLVRDLVADIQSCMRNHSNISEQLALSFDAHFRLVSIHPFYDGNGRTSRLLMNYIQAYYRLPLAIVDATAKGAYFQAIVDTRESADASIFRNFMEDAYQRQLISEIERYGNTA